MKSIMLSFKPNYIEKIFSNKKKIDVRKIKPNIEPPFKCYMYCTKNKGLNDILWTTYPIGSIKNYSNGKIVGEFICDDIYCYNTKTADKYSYIRKSSGFTEDEFKEYINNSERFYVLTISDVIMYNELKSLTDFRRICTCRNKDNICLNHDCISVNHIYDKDMNVIKSYCCDFITKAPQSYYYVEEI